MLTNLVCFVLAVALITVRVMWYAVSFLFSPNSRRIYRHNFSVYCVNKFERCADPPEFVAEIDVEKYPKFMRMPAVELARCIRTKELSSVQVTQAFIQAIKDVNPVVHAVCAERFELALMEARKADETVARAVKPHQIAALPPLLGVPCTIKECFAVEGMPHTSGLASRKGTISQFDATCVARLKQAGCVVLCVTNVSELCMWMETHNSVYGRTRNPYDPWRHVGGSSGGEAAINACGASPFGLGSDVGGSIRLPSMFCGVFGHKPSGGLVPNTGQYPTTEHSECMLVTGPICRYADDLMPLLSIMAGPDNIDPACVPYSLKSLSDVDVRQLNIFSLHNQRPMLARGPTKDILGGLERVENYFRQKGTCRSMERVRFENFKYAFFIWSSKMSAAGGPSFALLLGGKVVPIETGKELLKWALGKSNFTIAGLALAVVEKTSSKDGWSTRMFCRKCDELRTEIELLLGERGVLIMPTFPSVAQPHFQPLVRNPLDFAYTGIINVLELPSTQVPLGLNAEGIPIGLQVVGARGMDHITIAVAMKLQEVFGGWQPPPRHTVTPTRTANGHH